MKRIFLLFLLILTLFYSTSCSFIHSLIDSRKIVRVEVGSFPRNIVYYVGESDTLDLDGGTVRVYTRGENTVPGKVIDASFYNADEWVWRNFSEYSMSLETGLFNLVSDIDFLVQGVYEVHIIWLDDVVGRFPVQVIER